jgi:hypothetical protein
MDNLHNTPTLETETATTYPDMARALATLSAVALSADDGALFDHAGNLCDLLAARAAFATVAAMLPALEAEFEATVVRHADDMKEELRRIAATAPNASRAATA